MPGYVVEVKARKLLSRFMTVSENISVVLDEALRLYANADIKLIILKPEKGKK